MNVLLTVGCNAYSHLDALAGAEQDATEVHAALSRDGNDYDKTHSHLLTSPTVNEIRRTLNACYPSGSDLGVFTFYFAGHGAAKAGTFYLCTRDSEAERLSTTAFPISELFTTINEFQPRQVNIIVDACQAGASSFDLNQLQKAETIGSSSASSVTFLGACSANEYAHEDAGGGLMTQQLLRCLRGDVEIQTTSPVLDLLSISPAVCSHFQRFPADQRPLFWGLNLFGNGLLANNPHFDPGAVERRFPVTMVRPNSKVGFRIKQFSPQLWSAYRSAGQRFDSRDFLNLLERILGDPPADIDDSLAFLQGVQSTMFDKASQAEDSFFCSEALLTCALPLLKLQFDPKVAAIANDTFKTLLINNARLWHSLLEETAADSLALCDGLAAATAELYYLPLRITKILGWLGFEIIAQAIAPALLDSKDKIRIELAERLLNQYEKSIVAVSDAQAPFLWVFLRACLLKKENELATRVLSSYFGSFVEKHGNISRAHTDGEAAFHYISSLGPEVFREAGWRPSNPSSLLATMLLFGAKLGQESAWDLRALDRKTSLFFVPSDYRDFTDQVIEHGINHTHQIGFGVWKLTEFEQQFNRAMDQTLPGSVLKFPSEKLLLCTATSLIFPDRLPVFLERLHCT